MEITPIEQLRRILETPYVRPFDEPEYVNDPDDVYRITRNGYTYVFNRVEEDPLYDGKQTAYQQI